MLRRLSTRLLTTLLALTSLATASAEDLFALTTGGTLLRLDSESPGKIINAVPLSGLQGGETVVGLDFRPTTGQLLAVGSTSRVYVVEPNTGVATAVGVPFSPALSGTHFAVNFNPTVDRLRLVSDTAQSLRLNPNDGAVAGTDTSLTYAVFDAGFGTTPRLVGASYTNNQLYATSTTLYAIDSARNTLVTIGSLNSTISPNGGTVFTVGQLGVNTQDFASLDISGQTGVAYASLTPEGGTASKLYTINLSTGTASLLGTIAGGNTILAIAVAPAPTPFNLVALRTGTPSTLIRFESNTGALATSAVSVTGLGVGETLLGIRYRRSTGVLYGLSSANRIYTMDSVTGAATALTPVGSPLLLNSSTAELAIDPESDRIRVITDTDQNLTVDPVTGLIISPDAALAYKAGDLNAAANPNLRTIAFDDPVGGTPRLLGIDTNLDTLVSLPAASNGQITTIGGLGIDAGLATGMDIAPDGTIFAAISNILYRINGSSGVASVVPGSSAIGSTNVRGLAAVPASAVAALQFTADTFKVIETNTAAVTISRTGPASGTATVDYTVLPDSPEAESNFDAVDGTLTFLHGETSRTISIPVKQNGSLDLFHTATMTLSNPIGGALGARTTSTLIIGDLNDRDGDGFPNDVEVAAGTDPDSVISTPFGGSAAGLPLALTVKSTAVRLNFATQNRDSITFTGTIPNLSPTVAPNSTLIVQLGHADGAGGVVKVFTFDAKGRAPKGLVFGKPAKGVSRFTVTLTKQAFAAALAGSGLVNQTLTKTPLPFESAVYFNLQKFTAARTVLYTAKATKSGLATLVK
jgi:hypothetical protein